MSFLNMCDAVFTNILSNGFKSDHLPLAKRSHKRDMCSPVHLPEILGKSTMFKIALKLTIEFLTPINEGI